MRMLGIRPGVFWALFVASVRMFVRNRAAVFFSLFLPLIIMLIFGVLNFEGSTTIQLGIVGMTVMQLGLFSVAFGFVQLKRTGALRRLFATPTSPVYFLGAQVASRLIIASFQVAILFGVGIWFGLQMFGDYASLAVIVLLGSVIFLAIGFAIAGWAKNEDQAAPVANLISLPMMFLSGVFFPRDAMPEFLANVTQFMPLTYVNEALRAIVNDGASLAALGPQLLGMGVWAVITFVLAVRLFRWE